VGYAGANIIEAGAGSDNQGSVAIPLYMERQLAVTQSLTLVGMTSSDLCFWLWWRFRGRYCLSMSASTTGVCQ